MSKTMIHSMTLLDGKKVLIFDPTHAPEGTLVYRITSMGEELPKGGIPGPKHVCTAKKTYGDEKVPPIKLTYSVNAVNGSVKYKPYWNPADGKRPAKPATKKREGKDKEEMTAMPVMDASPTTTTKEKKKTANKKAKTTEETKEQKKEKLVAALLDLIE